MTVFGTNGKPIGDFRVHPWYKLNQGALSIVLPEAKALHRDATASAAAQLERTPQALEGVTLSKPATLGKAIDATQREAVTTDSRKSKQAASVEAPIAVKSTPSVASKPVSGEASKPPQEPVKEVAVEPPKVASKEAITKEEVQAPANVVQPEPVSAPVKVVPKVSFFVIFFVLRVCNLYQILIE